MQNAAHSPIQHAYYTSLTRSVHSRLDIPSQSHWKQRSGNSWYEHQHAHISMATDILVGKSIEDIRNATSIDTELQLLQTYRIGGCPQNKDDLEPTLGRYWPIRHDLAKIDCVAMKGK